MTRPAHPHHPHRPAARARHWVFGGVGGSEGVNCFVKTAGVVYNLLERCGRFFRS